VNQCGRTNQSANCTGAACDRALGEIPAGKGRRVVDCDDRPCAGRRQEVDPVHDIDITGDQAPARNGPEPPHPLRHTSGETESSDWDVEARSAASSGEQPTSNFDVVARDQLVEQGASVLVDTGRGSEEWGEIEADAHATCTVVPERSNGSLASSSWRRDWSSSVVGRLGTVVPRLRPDSGLRSC